MKTVLPLCAAVALVGLSLAPSASEAANERDALHACSEALVQRAESNLGVSILGFRVDGENAESTARLMLPTVFTMIADNPETNEVVARARCIVNERARVTRFRFLPLEGEDA